MKLEEVILRGTRSGQAAASAVPVGTLYYVTDEFVMERSTGAAWQSVDELPTIYNAGNTGTALTLDWTNGRKQKCTLTGNVTFTLSNPTDGARYVIHLLTGAGSFTATWPASVLWPSGTAPTITATASKRDIVVLLYDSATTKYYGAFSQNY